MADIVIGFLQDQLAQLLFDPVSPKELESILEPFLPPMFPRNDERDAACLSGESLRKAVRGNQAGFESLQ